MCSRDVDRLAANHTHTKTLFSVNYRNVAVHKNMLGGLQNLFLSQESLRRKLACGKYVSKLAKHRFWCYVLGLFSVIRQQKEKLKIIDLTVSTVRT